MAPIRILYIDEISSIGGGENWFLTFCDGLDNEEFEPILLAPSGDFARSAEAKGIQVIEHTFRSSDASVQKLLRYPLLIIMRLLDVITISRIIKQENISIVHSLNINGHVLGSFLKSLYSIKILWHIHLSLKRSLYKYFNATCIVFVAGALQQSVKFILSKKNVMSCVIYNGIKNDILRCEKEGAANGVFTIGYVGRLTPFKGLDEFLAAVSLVIRKTTSVQFSLFGEETHQKLLKGNYKMSLEKRGHELHIEKYVTFHGFVEDQRKIYSQIDCLVLPSYREAFPFVILEAMASGVPVIATNVGGIPELIADGETGFLIPPKNPKAIADAVTYVIENPEKVKTVVENARKLVREKFDYRENARQFVQLYRELLDE